MNLWPTVTATMPWSAGPAAALASPALFLEYEDVLARPEICRLHGLSAAQIRCFLDGLALRIRPVAVYYRWRPLSPDPKDDMVLELAINGRADMLVSMNGRDLTAGARWFGLRVVSPGEALQIIRERTR